MIIWKKNYREYSPFFPPEAPAPKNNRFRGTFENSIGYVYQEKHVPRCWGECVKKKLHGLYIWSDGSMGRCYRLTFLKYRTMVMDTWVEYTGKSDWNNVDTDEGAKSRVRC